jgi:hypothetical protein
VRLSTHLDVALTKALGPGLLRQGDAYLGRVVEVCFTPYSYSFYFYLQSYI